MKKKILIAYDKMIIGGTTTSLLSILDRLSPELYDVDLLLYYKDGTLNDMIPDYVNTIFVGDGDRSRSRIRLALSFLISKYFLRFLVELFKSIRKRTDLTLLLWQYTNVVKAKLTEDLSSIYDCSIGFMEGWSNAYITKKTIKSNKKICWVHLDYKDSYLRASSYKEVYLRANKIVLVSVECLKNFQNTYPELKDKAVVIENILSQNIVRKRADLAIESVKVDTSKVNFVSVCRIVFAHKGLDRAMKAFLELKDSGVENFCWYIIGSGQDEQAMKNFVLDNGLSKQIYFLGPKKNPLPYVKMMDAFLLPSRYEGKPMAITEAQMLGKPCIVCDYASAKEQIVHGKTGLIAKNNDEDIKNVLYSVLEERSILSVLASNALNLDFSNDEEMKKIERLFE